MMKLLEEIRDLEENKKWNTIFQMMHIDTRQMNDDQEQSASMLSQNREKNRYRNVLPYDKTRVKLKTSEEDYINANYVQVPDINRKYILAQGPLENTCEDFWRMVLENGSTGIVMLNRIIEKNSVKCHPYWPMGEGEVAVFGDFQIVNKEEQLRESYIIREFVVTDTKLSETRNVKQYHFELWPDFGVPTDSKEFLEFWSEIKESGILNDPDCPPVVHCSAGIGRSGTFCLVDGILAIAERDGTLENIDIRNLLLHFRKCRCGLVQTPEQYRFANLTILHGLRELFPDLFKDEKFLSSVDNNDGEPPPLPPRNTSRVEDRSRQAIYQQIIDESTDEESDDEEEIIDLSDDNMFSQIQPRVELNSTDDTSDTNLQANQQYPQEICNMPTAPTDPQVIAKQVASTSSIATTTKVSTDTTVAAPAETGDENEDDIIPVGSKASGNEDLRLRLREKKKHQTKELIENIKRRMKESENSNSSFQFRHLLYAGAGIGVCVGIYMVVSKWWN